MRLSVVRAGRRLLAVAIVGALASGCGFFGGGDGGGGGSAMSVPDVKLDASGNVKGAIASIQREWSGYTVNVDVLNLQRHDKALRLTFVVTPRSSGNTDDFPDGFFASDGYSGNTSGVSLIDTKHMRMYNPLHAGETCICSRNIDGIALDEPTVLFADFPVPPESVTDLTVVLPVLGPLPGVAVS